jgi:CHAT domain-containing protein/Tfp pilus assembly protein PilF
MECDQRRQKALRLRQEGKLAEAVAAAEQVLAIEREVLGEAHADVAETLEWIASVQEEREEFAAAREARKAVLAIVTKLYGEKDWRVTDARLTLADVTRLENTGPDLCRRLADAQQSVNTLYHRGRYAEAIEAARRAQDILKQALGEKHRAYAAGLNTLAALYHHQGEHAKAEPLYHQCLEIRKEVLGERHPAYAESLNNLAALYTSRGEYTKAEPLYRQALEIRKQVLGEGHPDYATSLNALAGLYKFRGEYTKAEPLFRQALEIRKRVLGERHPDYATSLNNLAVLYHDMGDYARAEPLCRQDVDITKQAFGEKHPAYATSLNNLAHLYYAQGAYVQAEPLFRQALEIRKQALGEKHPDYATSLNNLAALHQARGDHARAEPLYRQALEIRKQVLGEKHPAYARSLNNLALLYQDMGDYARAEPLCRQALEIIKQVLGEKHPDYAQSLNNLAVLYYYRGDHAKAEPLFRQALEIKKQVLGERHPDYALSLNCLAALYWAQGKYAQAEPLFREALDLRKRALGERHPDYAISLGNLAELYHCQGEYARAEPLFRQELHLTKEALGEQHPDYAISLSNLAALYYSMGDYAQAERLARQGMDVARRLLDLSAAIQSERQQLAMNRILRNRLDLYLSLALAAKAPAESAYVPVLAWKGAVLARQRHLREARQLLRQSPDPAVAKLSAELEAVTRRLGALALSTPTAKDLEGYRRSLDEMSQQRERLESQLAQASREFRRQRMLARLTPDQVQQLLPRDVALIDFLEYTHYSPPPEKKGPFKTERRLLAFVVRQGRALEVIDLGPVRLIAAAIDQWRPTMKRTQPVRGDTDPAAELRRLVWQPLEKHLQGARTVLISPDGTLARLPFAALPGKEPGRYLIEEVALGVVAVPQLVPELLAASERGQGEPSLLLVGDVDFDAAPGAAAAGTAARTGQRRAAGPGWQRLAATRGEVATIRDSFEQRFAEGRTRLLRGGQATEAAVRQQAGKHRYLHLATHGFFAPPEMRFALSGELTEAGRGGGGMVAAGDPFGRQGVTGFHPGLLSGIVLAGANRVPEPGQDDGILTALEVAELDLGEVELAVLSACETGLGQAAGGEGLLGLQRAFQIAGARSVVASLWSVDDEATRKLMVRFYENLWEKQLPKLEALREAQLWLLKEGVERGMVRVEEEAHSKRPPRTPPYYWAAFVLSGDWR